LPGARFVRPENWTDTDKENFDRFLKTPSGAKFLLTLHALVTDRALSVCDRTPYEHGMTGGMSFLLGEIERLACEGDRRGAGQRRRPALGRHGRSRGVRHRGDHRQGHLRRRAGGVLGVKGSEDGGRRTEG